MSVIKGNHGGLGGSGAPGGALGSFYSHTIDQSLKIDDASGGYLTISSASPTATNRKKVTISCWVKRAGSGSGVNTVFWADGAGLMLQFFAADSIYIYDNGAGGYQAYVQPESGVSRLFRDFSAWYHLALIIDTTQSTEANRSKFYINGTLNAQSSYPGQNTDINWHTGSAMRIGSVGDSQDLAGYIAEFISIDGQDVSISDLGETKDGVWVPKNVSGLTLGNAGFYLKFDNSSDIGNDSGSNNIDFTATNLVATDVVPDSPTNNFATMNPIYHSSSQATLSEGNLKVDGAGFVNAADGYGAVSTFSIPKDKKIYIEVECTDGTSDNWFAGFASQSGLESGPSSTSVGGANAITVYNRSVYVNGSETDYGSSAGLGGLGVAKLSAGDILGCMCDGATGKVWFSRNGTYFKSPSTNNSGTTGDPAGGNHEIGTITNGTTEDVFFVIGSNTSVSSIFVNFGQDSVNVASASADGEGIGTFEYAPPTDYLALCASNLSDPTIGPGQDTQADDHFNTVLYTGDADNDVTATNTFAADWVWLKNRTDSSTNHYLQDSVRGFGASKSLSSNTTGTEGYNGGAPSSHNIVTSSSSLRLVSSDFATNAKNFVAWTWKAGTSFSNDASATSVGNVDSAGSVNQAAGFGIIGYTGANQSEMDIAHGLGATPEFILLKDRDSNSNNNQFHAWHKDINTDYIYFSGSGASATEGDGYGTFKTAHTDTLVKFRTNSTANTMTESGDKYIMYLFRSIEGYSKVGEYTGNGNADGTFVYTGFRPAWVMIKRTDSTGSWNIADAVRSPDLNEVDEQLQANLSNAESTTFDFDFLSNGFKARTTDGARNASGGNYIYLAFAEAPFKFANAR